MEVGRYLYLQKTFFPSIAHFLDHVTSWPLPVWLLQVPQSCLNTQVQGLSFEGSELPVSDTEPAASRLAHRGYAATWQWSPFKSQGSCAPNLPSLLPVFLGGLVGWLGWVGEIVSFCSSVRPHLMIPLPQLPHCWIIGMYHYHAQFNNPQL